MKTKGSIASVRITLSSGTEFVYYPERGQVQVLVIAHDGFIYKEATVEVERFLALMEEISEEKANELERT